MFTGALRGAFRGGLGGALAAALSGLAWLLFLPIPRDADMAAFALAGLDMAHGNWRLAGWWLPSDSDATLDIPLYALAAWFGVPPLPATYLVPAALWGLIGTLAVLAAGRARGAVACVLACLAVPAILAPRPRFQISMAPDHIACVAALLLAMLAVDRAATCPAKWRPAWLGLAVLPLLLAVIGDPMAIFVGVLPILAASLVHIRRGEQARVHAAICAICVLTVPLAKFLVTWNAGAGGFTPVALRFSLSLPSRVLPHLMLTASWLAQFLGADMTRLSVRNPASLLTLARLPLALLFGWTCVAVGRRIVRPEGRLPGYLDVVLWFAVAADIASTAFSGLIVDEASCRYMIPAYVFGTVLLARSLTGAVFQKAAVSGALACTVLVACGMVAKGVPSPAGAPLEIAALAMTLDRSGVVTAYAPYGAASLATALTQGRVPVRALWTGDGGRLRPFPWVAKSGWYRVAANAGRGRIAFVVHDVTPIDAFGEADVEALMGPPGSQMRSGSYLVDLYDAGGAGQASLLP